MIAIANRKDPSMITLYTWPTPNGHKAQILVDVSLRQILDPPGPYEGNDVTRDTASVVVQLAQRDAGDAELPGERGSKSAERNKLLGPVEESGSIRGKKPRKIKS